MNFSSLSLVSLMKAKMAYSSERQIQLATNIANADTPGYKARDIAKPDFKRMLAMQGGDSLQMAVTNPQHIAHQNGQGASFRIEKRPFTGELNPDGNNVSTEDELAKVADNQADYSQVVNLYSKTIALFKNALGSGSSGG